MMNLRKVAAAVGCIGVIGALPAQQGKPVVELATDGVLHDSANVATVPKPVGWSFAGVKSQDVSDVNLRAIELFATTAHTPEFGEIDLSVWLLNGSRPTERLQAIFERDGNIAQGNARKEGYRLWLDPVPHTSYPKKSAPEVSLLHVHRRGNGRGMTVSFALPTEHLEKARATLLQLAQKVTVDLSVWPPREQGYDYKLESGFEIAFSPDVKRKQRTAVHKLVKSVVKDFTKVHGAPVFPKGLPVVIYVDNSNTNKAQLLQVDDGEIDVASDYGMRRLVTSELQFYNENVRATFAARVNGYLLFSLYPQDGQMWMHWGEGALVRMKSICGKSFPSVPESWHSGVRTVDQNLADVIKKAKGVKFASLGSWVGFFRIGPSKYRKAYAAYLDELRTGHDPEAAVKALQEACASDTLRRDARKLLGRKLKIVK